jgi:hypothetical protein
MTIELHERLAALEERVEIQETVNDKILKHVESIDSHLNRYKGFIGAIWFALSCVGVFFSAIKYFHKG